jgi:prolyl-tRNA synthetase
MLNIDNLTRFELNKRSFEEVLFPTVITKEFFGKEKEHIKGFDSQVYWVTKAGESLLEKPLVLRPTSETAMYPMFALWIRSHADLPLKIYQFVNVYRYETKQTRSFIRVREIHFFEAHTCHENYDSAEKQITEYFEIIKSLTRKLCLPYIATKRPDWDKFPGAFYSIGFDVLMPTGKTLQIASVHQYKENFSMVYNIKYENIAGEHKYVHQTTFGMSERLIGAIISIHKDERGLILPPEIAPTQLVIVPIFVKELEAKEVLKVANEIKQELEVNRFRVKLDDRKEITPGNKFYYWERRGVPLRIEIGPNEVKAKTISFVKRTGKSRIVCPKEELIEKAKILFSQLQNEIYDRAKNFLKNNIKTLRSLKNLKKLGIYRVFWCGKRICALELENKLGMNVLGLELDSHEKEEKCITCNEPSNTVIYLAKTY